MHIIVSRKEILKALQRVQGVTEKKTSQTILTYVLIKAEKDKIVVMSTDLKIVMKATYNADVKEEGAIAVSAKMLLDIIKEIDADEINIYEKTKERIIVEAGKSIFKLMGIDPEEYPVVHLSTPPVSFKLKRDDLLDMINRTLFTVGSDESSGYTLNGLEVQVMLNLDQDTIDLQFAGTDGHRLSIIKKSIPANITFDKDELKEEDKFHKIIVPKKTIVEIKKLLSEDEDEVIIGFAQRFITLQKNGVEIFSRLLEGMYPQYEKVIPDNIQKKIYMDKVSFEKAIRRVALLTSEVTSCVEMALEQEKVILRTENPMVGDAMETLAVEYSGNGMMIGFNYRYMLDVLPEIKNEKVLLELETYDKPMLVRDLDNPDFIYLLMPVMFKESEE